MKEIITSRIAFLISSLVSLILFGTFLFRHLEDWSWAESFYFSVVSVTTVGYGDLHPTTDVSRIATAFYVLFGVSIAVASLGAIGGRYLTLRDKALGLHLNRVKHDIIKHEDELKEEK